MQSLVAFAENWLDLYSLHMVESTIFLLVVLLASRILNLQTHTQYAILVLALLKWFIPPVIVAPNAISSMKVAQVLLPPVTIAPKTASAPMISPALFILSLWIGNIVLVTTLALRNARLLDRQLEPARPMRPADQRLLPELSLNVHLFFCDGLSSPLIRGMFRHRLYLPADFFSWPASKQHCVLAHEFSHLRNRDGLILFLQTTVLILFGLNPLLWLLHARLNEVRELRCDEDAVTKNGISVVEYSRHLYDFLEAQAMPAGSACFAQKRTSILRRFQYILSLDQSADSKHRRTRFALPIMLALLLIPLSCRYTLAPTTPAEPELLNEPQAESIFVAYDRPPEPIGGFATIQRLLRYPPSARDARIEGKVILNVLVAENGTVEDVRVLRSLRNRDIDQAAIEAVRAVKWRPATQLGRPVRVWVGLPVIFRLKK